MSDVTRPLIGITTYVETTRFLVHDTRAAVVPWAYTEQVAKAGGRPVLVPPMPDGGVEVLEGLDGLIVAGGADVEPARYGEAPHPKVYTSPLRDAGELPLVRIALKTGVPLLGVCRGMQVMAVASGGRLHQHLPDVAGVGEHSTHGPIKVYAEHPVRFATSSRLRELYGAEAVVNSYHHQAVKDPGRLVPTGWCSTDDVIEAVEHPDHPFAVGVQWHPEDMAGNALFQALVNAATQVRHARASRAEFFATV
ncbi:gamma-glutamyl-gamma-aminobutyrate hydrolase family protein [Catellatospora sichuanensis]|uniref:gamma-glutamyl-gamma-aminobutyrate hydrolase family protein n=1 Tax=Catellatospora sichuanensis TaxID=1969805 RepID=UPI001182EB8B|nr:gamma-glutamyl-gamma-aminobutyrate hydrolase family protein [Catellatospora sichuanensis]